MLVNNSRTLKVQTTTPDDNGDLIVIEFPYDHILKYSGTLKNMIQDIGDDSIDAVIPLQFKAKYLSTILEWVTYHGANPTAYDIFNKDDDDDDDDDDSHSPFDKKEKLEMNEIVEFDINLFSKIHVSDIFELTLITDFLDMKNMLDRMCRYIATQLAGKSTQQMRDYLGVENDFTPEEEEAIRQEWITKPTEPQLQEAQPSES